MRHSQPQGLPPQADEFLKINAIKLNECQHCHKDDGYQREVIGFYGMFKELKLYRYTLVDGSTADEFIQREIWCSGPVIWLALKWKNAYFEWEKLVEPSLGG